MATAQKSTVKASSKPASKPAATKAATPAAKTPPTAAQKPKSSAKPAAEAQAQKFSLAVDAPAKDVEKMIVSIKTRGAKLDTDIHSTACACLYHADKHGDITLMNRLITAMPKTVRRNALTIWAIAFGKFSLSEDKATMELAPLAYDKAKTTQLEAAQAKPFWEFRNVREGGSEWLYMDYIGNVMKTLARVAADPQNKEAAKAKAALDAITAVNEALNTAPAGGAAPTWKSGDKDRRGTVAMSPAPQMAQ